MADWVCGQTGACCRHTATVQVSESELALLEQARPDVVPIVVSRAGGRAEMAGGPCPYLGADSRCTVYAVRPWRCRVYACFRKNTRTDVYRPELLQERLAESAGVRRVWGRMVHEAADWGRQHGWVDEHSDPC